MTEPQEPQVLSSFNTEAIAGLRGAIDPREILVRAQQYPTLRMLLDDKDIKQKIGEALVKNDPEMLRGLLLGIFNEARTYKRQEMTEVPAEEPFAGEAAATAPKLTTQEYVARIDETESASRLVIEQRKTEKRHEFAKKLTDNFVKQSHKQFTEERKRVEINRVERDLFSPDWYNNKEQIANTLRQSSLADPIDGKDRAAMARVAKIAIAEADRVANSEARFEAVITAAASSIAADEVVVHRPGVFLKIAAVQAERSTKVPVAQIIDRAAALERATIGFTGNEEELPLRLSVLAKTPVQKLVAGVVDILPEGPREAIVAGVVGKAWEKAVGTATQYYGQQVVNTDWFGQALTHGSQGLTDTKSALQSITGGTQKVLADVAVTVFRGEMDEATLAYIENIRQHTALPTMASAIFRKPAGEMAVVPTETRPPVTGAGTAGAVLRGPAGEAAIARMKTIGQRVAAMETAAIQPMAVQQYIMTMGPVSYQQFYAAAVYSHNPGLLSYGLSLGFRYGAKKAINAGLKKGVEKAVISTATKGTLEAILGLGTGGIGTLVTIAVDLGWSFLKGLFNKGVSFFKSLVGMGTSKNPEDNLLLVIGAGVVLVFFLPIFPLLNIPAFNQSMIDTSLATNIGGGMESGPIVNCQLTPDDPQCTFTACVGDCRWPASGYISQGPRTGTYCSVRTSHASGSAANGIDIAGSGGPVYTPRGGTVVEVYTGCGNNSGYVGDRCGGTPRHPEYAGYGNHVILTTDDGYTLIFGHLESAVGVQVGQHVSAGAQLGWMDQTGSSSGTHLHFGVLAGGNVLDFVPTGDPALSPDAINGCEANTPGCTKSCPTTPVTAGI